MSEELNAPDGDSTETGGQGGEGEAVDYAGYETPEALIEAHTGLVGEMTTLKEQNENLERLKGTQGNELGTLRTQVATLNGQINGMKAATPATQGPTVDDIAAQVDSGKISEAEGLRQIAKLSTQQTEQRLTEQFNERLNTEIGNLKAQTEQEKFVAKFISDNPGYEEAFNTGKLSSWLNQGMDGQTAWDKYQLQAKDEELTALKEKSAAEAKAAEEAGLNKGLKIEQGKSAAGKVLTGKGGKFAQANSNYDLTDPNQRRQAGIERLNQLRSG